MMEKMIGIFEDDDDVQNVWHNWDRDEIKQQGAEEKPLLLFQFKFRFIGLFEL